MMQDDVEKTLKTAVTAKFEDASANIKVITRVIDQLKKTKAQ